MNLLRKLKNKFSQYKSERKQQIQIERLRNKNKRIYLSELNGKIYIKCEGIAIYEAKDGEQANQIVEKMNEMRNTANLYEAISEK